MTQLTINLTKEDEERLKSISKSLGKSKTDSIKKLIRDFNNKNKIKSNLKTKTTNDIDINGFDFDKETKIW